ncbi:hypothetical protein [Snodgrassella communis]|uniref:hypothetical protein n=1 Tax=Snodgrassella communis TaxID=2946699 RepID=UPI001EF6E3FA|nr:hypothetical protein [Snodgrassella communis]
MYITQTWLIEHGACENGISDFNAHFPDGWWAWHVLALCEDLGYIGYVRWLIENLYLASEP